MTDTAEKTNLVAMPAQPKREIAQVVDPIPVLDTARFEHMQRISTVMARGSLIPDALRKTKVDKEEVWLSEPEVIANCFLVVNQAVRWGMDPFAVAQCVSVVHGRLCYEGKLVAAVLDAKLGVRLNYEWSGSGEAMRVVVKGRRPGDEEEKTITGTVAEWKTTGAGSPWKPSQYQKMLAYRGAREWARLWAPGLMLGVYSEDEMSDLAENVRSNRAQPVPSLASRFAPDTEVLPAPRKAGFSTEHVDAETGEITQSPAAQAAVEDERPRESAHQQEVSSEAGEQVAPSTPALPAPPAKDAPVEEWIAFAEAVLKDATAETVEDLWNDHVAGPLDESDLFDGDHVEVVKVFRRREAEVAP